MISGFHFLSHRVWRSRPLLRSKPKEVTFNFLKPEEASFSATVTREEPPSIEKANNMHTYLQRRQVKISKSHLSNLNSFTHLEILQNVEYTLFTIQTYKLKIRWWFTGFNDDSLCVLNKSDLLTEKFTYHLWTASLGCYLATLNSG